MSEMTVQAALADINDTLDSLHAFLDGNLAVEYVGMLHRGISNLLAAVLVQQMAQNERQVVSDSLGQSQKPPAKARGRSGGEDEGSHRAR